MIRHLIAILALPFTAVVLLPTVFAYCFHELNFGWGLQSPFVFLPIIVGALFMCTGSVLMYQTIALFATIGKGTLAPWDPPKNLVVNGIYRHVRNPMISGVCFLLLGETLIMGSSSQAIWTLTFWLANVIYLPLVEEPKLDKRFGEDYENYKKNVPRWIPMRTAWNPDSSDSP